MKFDPVRIQARDSISETRNSLMSATVGQLSAAFSTRSRRGEFRRNARFPCRQATSATWSRGLVGTRSNVTFFRAELLAKLRWPNVFNYFFEKFPPHTFLDGKANDTPIWVYIFSIHRCGHVAAEQRRSEHDHPFLSPFEIRRQRFPPLLACWRKREICRGTKTSLMEKLDARREGRRVSTIPFDSVYLRDSLDSKLTVLYTSLRSDYYFTDTI